MVSRDREWAIDASNPGARGEWEISKNHNVSAGHCKVMMVHYLWFMMIGNNYPTSAAKNGRCIKQHIQTERLFC